MRISRLKIKNFRSIEEMDVPLPQVCALVGPNNAGKSNILEGLKRVLAGPWLNVGSFTEDDVFRRDQTRDIEITCTLEPPVSYSEFKNGEAADIHSLHFQYTRYKIGEKKGERRLDQKCLNANGDVVKVLAEAPKKGQQHKYKPLTIIPSEVRSAVPLIHIGTNRSLAEQLPSARYSLLRQMFEDIDRDLHSPHQKLRVQHEDGSEHEVHRADHFRALITRAMEILRTDAFLKVERAIKQNALRQLGLDPEIDADKLDLSFSAMGTLDFYKSLDLLIREDGFTISASETGGGVQNAIVIAILRAFEETRKKGAILLIEEPEMFLHPQMQRSLYKTLRQIGTVNQVIYTTHSPHFVSVPEYPEVMLVRKEGGHTQSTFSALPLEQKRREKLVKELDPERGELFFARRLLLVEGDTEKLALPAYAEKGGLNLDSAGATIVEVGGKRNLMEFAEIAISFGIPTGIIYDRDSSDFDDKSEEESYNKKLDALATPTQAVKVWMLDRNYEDHLRHALGESNYQRLCQKFSKTPKPTRARLIALEQDYPVPAPFGEILQWLAAST